MARPRPAAPELKPTPSFHDYATATKHNSAYCEVTTSKMLNDICCHHFGKWLLFSRLLSLSQASLNICQAALTYQVNNSSKDTGLRKFATTFEFSNPWWTRSVLAVSARSWPHSYDSANPGRFPSNASKSITQFSCYASQLIHPGILRSLACLCDLYYACRTACVCRSK
jgi:hypothetical protein